MPASTGKACALDPRYLRPSEVDALVGDASKARAVLGWKADTTAPGLARLMVDADIAEISERPAVTAFMD